MLFLNILSFSTRKLCNRPSSSQLRLPGTKTISLSHHLHNDPIMINFKLITHFSRENFSTIAHPKTDHRSMRTITSEAARLTTSRPLMKLRSTTQVWRSLHGDNFKWRCHRLAANRHGRRQKLPPIVMLSIWSVLAIVRRRRGSSGSWRRRFRHRVNLHVSIVFLKRS